MSDSTDSLEMEATDVITAHVLASERSGTIRLVDTTIDTGESLIVLADDCQAVLGGDRLDCSTGFVQSQLRD